MKSKISAVGASIVALAVMAVSVAVWAEEPEYSVDFGTRVGALKPVNGINYWSQMSRETLPIENQHAEAAACHFSTIRLHDIPLQNGGTRLVDVQMIFGNLYSDPDADPSDPKNYFFGPTDDYIENILKGGSIPVYRLGTSIERARNKYFAKKPKDPARYAEICAGIVRHYNAGWANGYEWNLPYWEIWNEPDLVPEFWDDPDWNSFVDFYVVVAKRLKSEFPNIKVGGPALTWADPEKITALAKKCKEEGAPLDFFSWHGYASRPEDLILIPYRVRELLDGLGFENTELHLNEWHYVPVPWNRIHGTEGGSEGQEELLTSPEGMQGADAAAFIAIVLTRWQDGPLTMGNYYAFGLDKWGLFDHVWRPRPTYYAFLLFGELIDATPERVETHDPRSGVSLLGAANESGDAKRLLVSHYKRDDPKPIRIALKGVPVEGEVEVSLIDYDHVFETKKVRYSDGVLTLEPQRSSVFLVRF